MESSSAWKRLNPHSPHACVHTSPHSLSGVHVSLHPLVCRWQAALGQSLYVSSRRTANFNGRRSSGAAHCNSGRRVRRMESDDSCIPASEKSAVDLKRTQRYTSSQSGKNDTYVCMP